MSERKLVSVIVPCFNQGRYLPDCVGSLQKQTHTDWECIIVDDGSDDETPQVARALGAADERIRLVQQENRGLAGARNTGLENARGEFVQLLDADDLLFPEKFEIQLAALGSDQVPGVAYCRPFYCLDDEVDKEISSTRPFPLLDLNDPLTDLAERWEKEVVIPCHTFLFDARLFKGLRFDESLPNHEDFDCWMGLFARQPRVIFVDQKLVVYRRHAESMCRDPEGMRQGFLTALRRQRELHKDNLELRWILQRRIHELERRPTQASMWRLSRRPLVSVILTSYNYEQYVGQSIRSVFTQSYRRLELIVVDDGSKDGSRKVIEGCVANAPIPVHTVFKANRGQASAFNAGYTLVRGDVVCFLDSDDYWYEDRVEKVVDFMRLFPGGAVYQHQMDTGKGEKRSGLLSGDVFGLWKKWGQGSFNIADDHEGALFSPFLPTSGLSFPRAVLDQVFPIPESLITCPDAFLTRSSTAYGPLYSIPLTLGMWRDHDENSGKKGFGSFSQYWEPVIMPALNRYYRNQKIGLELRYEFEKRSPKPAARLLGEPAPPLSSEQTLPSARPPAKPSVAVPSKPSPSAVGGESQAKPNPAPPPKPSPSLAGRLRRRCVAPVARQILSQRSYNRLRGYMLERGWIG